MAQIADGSFFERIFTAFEAGDPDVAAKEREAGHVRCIQLMFHAVARNAFDECLDLATDDLVFEVFGPANSPHSGRWEGKPEVKVAMMRNFAAVRDQRPEVESVIAQGDTVIIVANETGRLVATETTYSIHWVQQFTFANGKVRLVREFVDSGARWDVDD